MRHTIMCGVHVRISHILIIRLPILDVVYDTHWCCSGHLNAARLLPTCMALSSWDLDSEPINPFSAALPLS